ncbi:MAG: hypothetical protein H6867_09305 [Rhodospirillales bacterium]|nr:hypothetical protein [Rhodospirillales bacterium]
MSHRYSWNDSRGSAVVWIGTVFVALAILGVSVYVAVTRTPPADIPPPQQVYTPPVEAPEPEVILPPAEEIAEPAPQVREAPEAEALPAREPEPESVIEAEPEGPAILQLDNLAGTIKLAVPFLSVRNKMPLEHTCYRNNMSPALRWGSAPEATQSYVVFLEKREEGG